MLELRPGCECCDTDLPPDSTEAMICTFECTWCAGCAETCLGGQCPNCGGDLQRRPVRPASHLPAQPAATQRVVQAGLHRDSPAPRSAKDVIGATARVQLETFLDEHRAALDACLNGLTEEQARRSLVPSKTTLLGLVKHATFVEKVWFAEAVTGRSRAELGIEAGPDESFELTEDDTIATVRTAYRTACEESRLAVADLDLDDLLPGNRRGPLPLRWVYLHMLRELAQHCGHADILREQL